MKLLTILILSAAPLFCQGIEGGSSSSGGGGNTTICNGSASATVATCPGVPAPTTYGLGTTASPYLSGTFIPGANTTAGSLTLNIAGLGAKSVFVSGSSTVTLTSGTPYGFQYDGTQIQVLSGGGSGGASTTAGTSVTLTSGISQLFVCTSTCTITVPVPANGAQYCIYNDDNVNTVITLAAIGSSARYENTARTTYGTAGTGTLVSGGAVGDAICINFRDSTHYSTLAFTGTWTAN